jgi:hypothetical protein
MTRGQRRALLSALMARGMRNASSGESALLSPGNLALVRRALFDAEQFRLERAGGLGYASEAHQADMDTARDYRRLLAELSGEAAGDEPGQDGALS